MCATRRKSVFFRTRRVFNLDYVSIKNPASRTEKSHFSYLVAQITIVNISIKSKNTIQSVYTRVGECQMGLFQHLRYTL
jgi:uncharacterized membrane protein (UPF0182 family)